MTLLELTPDEAREFLLCSEQYCNFRLPEYFNFSSVLDYARKSIGSKDESQLFVKDEKGKLIYPSNYDGINYLLFSNKDGKLDYRPLSLINPFYYYLLVRLITTPMNWTIIVSRFKELKNSHFSVPSIPVVKKTKRDKASIWIWWDQVEQQSIQMSLRYKYMFVTDITNCYGSIYTHSISWALMGKPEAKQQKNNKDLLGNKLDIMFQGMQYGQTNGIPQGNVVSDLFAELVLAYADDLISKKVKENGITDYCVIRYRDDYRVFSNSKEQLEAFSLIMQKELANLNFRINSAKTAIIEDLVLGSIKADKVALMSSFLHRIELPLTNRCKKNLTVPQKELIAIYSFSKQFPNSGSVERLLGSFYDWLQRKKNRLNDWHALSAILISIAKENPRTYAIVAAIISLFIDKVPKEDRENLIIEIIKRVSSFPNSSLLLIWLQRISLGINLSVDYKDPLCRAIIGESVSLWENSWLLPNYYQGFTNNLFISQNVIDKMKVSIDKKAVSPFSNY